MLLRSWLTRFRLKLLSRPGRRKPQKPQLERLETRSLMSVTPAAVTFNATEGTAFSGTVATFTTSDHPAVTSNYTATIDWGDGSSMTTGSVAVSGSHFNVVGGHTYLDDDGQSTVKVTINDSADHSHATAYSQANVAEVPLTLTAKAIETTEGVSFSGSLGTFSDPGTSGKANEYIASINWGDGTLSSGTLSYTSGANFDLRGQHTYADEGTYTATVSVREFDSASTKVTSTLQVTVDDADNFGGTTMTFTATEGHTFSGVVNILLPANSAADPTDFTASIDWGDGQTSAASISVVHGSKQWNINGSHTYADEGTYTATTTLAEDEPHGASFAFTTTAVVSDADVLNGAGLTLAATEGTAFTGPVATFINTGYANNPAGDFNASIDWGDGTTDTGTISGSSGNFTVGGSHTYLDEGAYTPVVTLSDDDGTASATATSSMSVADADVLNGVGLSLAATEGTAFTGAVATFSNTGYASNPATDFNATIDWGDGNTDTGTVSGSAGSYTVTGSHTYLDEGAYTPLVTLNDDDGTASATASSSMSVADADIINGTGISLAATEGTAFTGAVATFSNTGYATNPASDFNATIDWGDGNTDTGTISGSAGSYTVTGSHTYLDEGSYSPVVTLSDDDGTASATASSSMSVADADVLNGAGLTLAATEGAAFSGAVATFSNTGYASNPASDFNATIDWGDGNTGTGTISGSAGSYTVTGSHTYLDEGSYSPVVTLNDDDGTASATASSSMTVAEGDVLDGTGLTLAATEGTAFSGAVATFSNTGYASNPASDFNATIDWGDGTTDTGTVSGGAGSYTVSGTHTYDSENTYTPVVTLTDSDGTASATASSAMTVAEGDVLNGTGLTLAATEGTAFSGAVATFSNTGYASNPASDFNATIDWGDGTSDTGTVSGSAGSYTVSGTHTYDSENTYAPVVTLTDSDGTASATASSAMSVAEGDVLDGTGLTLAATEGTAFSGAVATFINTGYASNPASDFNATIDWGDGTTDTGTVSGSAGSYTVSGTHTYDSENTYSPVVTLTDSDGTASATASSAMTVAEGDVLDGTGLTLAATEGTAFSGAVATFINTGYASNPASDFNATIDWGDGTTDTGTVSGSAGSYTVSGTHTYDSENTYSPVVTLTDSDGTASATASCAMTVAEGDVLDGTGLTLAATEGTAFTGAVATFGNTGYASNPASDFNATIDWGDGTTDTGTVSGSAGSYTVSGTHTYDSENTYSPVVTLTDSDGTASATASSAMTVAEGDVLDGTGLTLAATEGTAFTGAVATFGNTGYASNPASDFNATIDWGDGTTDTGTVSGSAGSYTVSGTHTYDSENTYSPVVTLTDSDGTASATASSAMTVAEGDVLDGTGLTLAATEGTAFSGAVATFSNTGYASNPASDFNATIDWGDGTTDTGTVSGKGGSYTVTGSHNYLDEGSYSPVVTLNDDDGNTSATASSSMAVADADLLSGAGTTLAATEGSVFSGAVASFATPNGNSSAGEFSATIDWGDGTTSTGTITGATGNFTVSGSHLYVDEGSFVTSIDVNENSPGTETLTMAGAASVAESDSFALTALPVSATQGTLFSGQVATFTDPTYAGKPLLDLTATINWGDGTSSAGKIADLGGGTFGVSGTHTWNSPASQIAVTVSDASPGTATATAQASLSLASLTIQNASPIVASSATVSGYEFTPLDSVTVATFTHAGSDPASNFTASIDWGDGTLSAGTVSLSGGVYTVTASHNYTDEGTRFLNVVIDDLPDNVSATITSTATMLEELLPGGVRGTANERFVSELYRDVLGRAVDAPSLAFWSAELTAGTSRTTVAAQMIAAADAGELRDQIIENAFQTYLHRSADDSALAYFGQLLGSGTTVQQLTKDIVSSDEYFNVRGGGTDAGFLNALYQDLLGRPIDSGSQTVLVQFMTLGGSREQIVDLLMSSAEYERVFVEQSFTTYLGRPADGGAIGVFSVQLSAGASQDQVLSEILGSSEYFNQVSS